jgi:hypothetical protein
MTSRWLHGLEFGCLGWDINGFTLELKVEVRGYLRCG